MTIKNKNELIKKLAEMLENFDLENNGYETDVYLCYDEETQTGELDTVIPGGWLDFEGDRYLIYTDESHESRIYSFQDVSEIAELVLGISDEKLLTDVRNYLELDDEDYQTWLNRSSHEVWRDVADYVEEKYPDKIESAHKKIIKDSQSDYTEIARGIFENFESERK